jgi:malate dehydrogenase
MRKKVSIIGTGNVGSALGQRIGQRGFADVVLLDIIEGMPQGKAIDMMHSHPIVGSRSKIIGTNGYEETAKSDLVVMVARSQPLGAPGGPKVNGGRTRLLRENLEMIKGITEQVIKYSPHCIIIVVTNPVDAMAWAVRQFSGFSKNRVMGLSGMLDTARFRAMLAAELDVSIEDVSACILGEHGENMVPVTRLTRVGVVPVKELLTKEKLDEIVERAKHGAGEVVKKLKTATPYYAPAMAIAEMAESILLDKKRILPVSAYLEGEYGINGIFIDVPAKIGAGGVEQVYEVKLTPDESACVKKSAQSVQEQVNMIQRD